MADWAVAAALLTTPAREPQTGSPAQREDVIVVNSYGQVWRIAPTGEIIWFTAVGSDFGLWLVTNMIVLRDGSILLGGRGDSDGPRWCGDDAQVVKLRSDGHPVWQWHFDLPATWTYVNQLIELDQGYLVLVGTSGPGAEMGSASNPCTDVSQRQWLAWLDPAGDPERILARPFPQPVDRLALLPAGRIAASGGGSSLGSGLLAVLRARRPRIDRATELCLPGDSRRASRPCSGRTCRHAGYLGTSLSLCEFSVFVQRDVFR